MESRKNTGYKQIIYKLFLTNSQDSQIIPQV